MTDLRPKANTRDGAVGRNLAWLAAGFAVPFVFADLLHVPRDLYYGIHAAAVLALFVLWARTPANVST